MALNSSLASHHRQGYNPFNHVVNLNNLTILLLDYQELEGLDELLELGLQLCHHHQINTMFAYFYLKKAEYLWQKHRRQALAPYPVEIREYALKALRLTDLYGDVSYGAQIEVFLGSIAASPQAALDYYQKALKKSQKKLFLLPIGLAAIEVAKIYEAKQDYHRAVLIYSSLLQFNLRNKLKYDIRQRLGRIQGLYDRQAYDASFDLGAVKSLGELVNFLLASCSSETA
ncbi:MAG: hypothetical protein R2880_09000 [Deinococcales bacterium]